MKVIGTTKVGYLLEAASWEVSYLSNGTASEKRASWGSDIVPIPIGTTFAVSPVIEHMHKLERAARNAREGASFLRGLADILDKGIPDWIAEPKPDPEAKPEEPAA